MPITAAEQKATERIIKSYLDEHLPSQIRIFNVKSSPQFVYDEEFLDVSVIYEGDSTYLDPDMLNGVFHNIEPQLVDEGVNHLPSIGYVPHHEWVLLPGNEWALPATLTSEV